MQVLFLIANASAIKGEWRQSSTLLPFFQMRTKGISAGADLDHVAAVLADPNPSSGKLQGRKMQRRRERPRSGSVPLHRSRARSHMSSTSEQGRAESSSDRHGRRQRHVIPRGCNPDVPGAQSTSQVIPLAPIRLHSIGVLKGC